MSGCNPERKQCIGFEAIQSSEKKRVLDVAWGWLRSW